MHAPFALRAKAEKAENAMRTWIRPRSWLVAIVIAGVALAAYFERGTLYDWFAGPQGAATILVSGNIEAHQSVLGFKTVQSRIVELPFDEGQWVDEGTLIARLDDSDYRQQVAINQAALDMQQHQLAAAEQNLTATGQTVESDAADLELQAARIRSRRHAVEARVPAQSNSAIRLTPPCGNRRPRMSATSRCRTPPSGKSNWPRPQSTARRQR